MWVVAPWATSPRTLPRWYADLVRWHYATRTPHMNAIAERRIGGCRRES